jgi:putative tryptophan/tyrosine transport system substrate-binding protein
VPVNVCFSNRPTAPVAYYLNPFKAAAESFGMEGIVAPVEDESELDSVVATQARQSNSGLIVIPDAFMVAHRAGIAMLAARYRIPAIYSFTFFAEAGGLMSYGINPLGEFQRAASYADRILKGAKASELPVQAPDKLQLVINLKTAKALGLDVPLFLRQRDRIRLPFAALHESRTSICPAAMSAFGGRADIARMSHNVRF